MPIRPRQARIARDSYTYLHFPMVTGIVLFALGVKESLIAESHELSGVAAVSLCGGVALYLLALSAFKRRNYGSFNYPRLAGGGTARGTRAGRGRDPPAGRARPGRGRHGCADRVRDAPLRSGARPHPARVAKRSSRRMRSPQTSCVPGAWQDDRVSNERTSPADITSAVLASFGGCADARLRLLMEALTRHLHAFASEVGLTQSEWEGAIRILTATGHITDERRQEFILWSDSLGLSMLVDALANPLPDGATESTVLGPFYVPGSPLRQYGANLAELPAGDPAWVHGRILGLEGEPIAGAELDVWQNGDDRLYAVQSPEGPQDHLRGRFVARDDGSYAFLAVRPVPYTIPDDGPVGRC